MEASTESRGRNHPPERAIEVPLDDYAAMYRDRFATLEANPPGADWAGVHIATSK